MASIGDDHDEGPCQLCAGGSNLSAAGIEMEDVAQTLEAEGVASFAKSFDELLQSLSDKANALTAGR